MATFRTGKTLKALKDLLTRKGYFDKNPGGGKDARKYNVGGNVRLAKKGGGRAYGKNS